MPTAGACQSAPTVAAKRLFADGAGGGRAVPAEIVIDDSSGAHSGRVRGRVTSGTRYVSDIGAFA